MSSYGLWLSAAGMKVNEHKQTLLANNLANANTTGFKRDLAVVLERPVESAEGSGAGPAFAHPVMKGIGGGVNVRPTYQDFKQGAIEKTGRTLDVAIDGEGFFAVTDGKMTRYTRDGEFALNRAGELVLSAGGGRWKVLNDNRSPVPLNPEGGAIAITSRGDIKQRGKVVGRLGVFNTQDKSVLRKVGENLFDAGDVTLTSSPARVMPEAREESNVAVVPGVAAMIEATRAYQLNATMIQMQDQLTGQVMAIGRPR